MRDTALSPSLIFFQKATKAPYALQAVFDAPYVNADCFAATQPTVVPMRTLLNQFM